MLNEQAIDKLIQPIVQRQEEINLYVLNFLAERIKDIDGLLPSDVYKIQRLITQGTDVKQLKKELAKMSGSSVSEIRNIIYEIAKDSYKDTLPFFKYRGIKFIPFFENVELQRVIQSIAKQLIQAVSSNTDAKIAESKYDNALGMAGINSSIAQNRYESALNTASINETVTAQTQKVLDALAQNKIESLQAQVNSLELQNAIAGVVKYPMNTSYAVPSPCFTGCACAM